jgi:hypothetical protein
LINQGVNFVYDLKELEMENTKNSCKYFRDEYSHHLKIKHPPFKKEGKSASGYYVCIQTLTVSGPDHGPVSPENCHGSRNCFIST